MESIAISLGVVPYLAGRTTLALGVLLLWYGLQGVISEGELSVRSVLLGILGGVATIALQFVVAWVRELLAALEQEVEAWMRRLEIAFAVFFATGFTLVLLWDVGGMLLSGSGLPFAAVSGQMLSPEFSMKALILLGVGVTAYAFASLRARIGELFDFIPLSDESSVRRVLFLAELVFTVAGLVVALLFPVVGVVVMVVLFALLVGVLLALRAVTRGARGPCERCAAEVHLAGSVCPACTAVRVPRRIGFLGRVLEGAPADMQKHQHSLLAARRCASCAERLETVEGMVRCPACRAPAFRDEVARRSFLRYVEARLAVLVPVLAVFGLVPVLGIGAGLVLYKLAPAGSLSAFVSWRERLGTRILRAVAVLALLFLQPIPVVGAFAVPGLVVLLHLATRRAFLAAGAPGGTVAGGEVRTLAA
ncbi:hypothetical protein ACLESO_06235 [Pyxidicoccus sp. 3LG]